LTISHDRFFLDRTSTKLWVLDGSGSVEQLFAVYSDYLANKKTEDSKPKVKSETAAAVQPVFKQPQKKKMTYKEKREWETIEADIEQVEQEIAETEASMETAGADYEKLSEMT